MSASLMHQSMFPSVKAADNRTPFTVELPSRAELAASSSIGFGCTDASYHTKYFTNPIPSIITAVMEYLALQPTQCLTDAWINPRAKRKAAAVKLCLNIFVACRAFPEAILRVLTFLSLCKFSTFWAVQALYCVIIFVLSILGRPLLDSV